MALLGQNISTCVALVVLLILLVRFVLSLRSPPDKNGNKMPNGPFGLPIVGSLPFMSNDPELSLDKWAKKYGPLYPIWLGNKLYMIISDPNTAKDLFQTNGAVFSSRAESYIKGLHVFNLRGITANPYNDRWRKHRAISQNWLSERAVDGYSWILDREATVMIKSLYNATKGGSLPVDTQPHAGRSILNNMLSITFGFRTNSPDHPLVGRALEMSREFMRLTGPVSNLVDMFPILQMFPNAMVIRGTKLNQDLRKTYGGFVKDVERKLQNGEQVQDCLAKMMIQSSNKEHLTELDVDMMAAAFMIGGVETTASVLHWFCALISYYPAVQKQAHEELDRVVGRDRLPSVADEANLPFIHAILKEVERYRNPQWLGTPHYSTEDFTYNGMFIPKGTSMVLNTYTMHHDPERFPDPHTFNPNRYLNDNLSSSEHSKGLNAKARDHWIFGSGRRVCPGITVAQRTLRLSIAKLLWAFEFTEVPGQPIELDKYDGLSGRSPIPFKVCLRPRDGSMEKVLEAVQSE